MSEPSAEVIEAVAKAIWKWERANDSAMLGTAWPKADEGLRAEYLAMARAALSAAGVAVPSETDLAITNLLNAVRAWHVEKHITDHADITTSECASEVCRRAAYLAWRRAGADGVAS